jgi:3-oxoadipate enol-lactonase
MTALRPVLERDGCVLHAADSGGSGIPVLFSHGAGADSVMFAPQYAGLVAAGMRVVTWDLRGHGRSRPAAAAITPGRALDDLQALIGTLRLDRPVLVGQSLGGNLSQAAIRRDPSIARGLVVIGSAWNAQPLSAIDRLLLRLATPSLAVIPAGRLPGIMAAASASSDGGRAYAETVFRSLSKREFLDAWRTTVGLLDADPEYRTPVPLCLIRGEHDRTGNIAAAMPRWAAAEGIDEHVIPAAGHIANLDAPDVVTAVIRDFVAAL